MKEVSARARIPLDRETCWSKLRDFTRALDYVPGLSKLRITTEAREGVGASRRVTHSLNGEMDETITAWKPGRGFWIRLHRGERPPIPGMREARFHYELDAHDAASTDIVLTMRYAPAWGPLGALLNALVLRRVLAKNLRDTALALAENYRSDARVTPERLEELRKESAQPASER